MGARIEAAATAHARGVRFVHGGPIARGSLRLTDRAARACLARGRRRADELDVLINAGLYKDRHLAEPALASIIQEDLAANPGHPPRLDRHGTFSFDVMNGGCGVLTAAHLVDGLVGAGTAQVGMVVAGDADPAPRRSHGFRFPAVGGALLLVHTDEQAGFTGFGFRTFVEDGPLFEARVDWTPRGPFGLARGHHALSVREDLHYGERCVEHAVAVARDFLAAAGLPAAELDLLIASQHPAGFAAELARRLGLRDDQVPHVASAVARAHTAGPIAALEAAIESGTFAAARHVLFVTAGAGITIGVALYRTERAG